MNTYNFIVSQGNVSMQIDIDAKSEDEAINIINNIYPSDEGWNFILI